MTVDVLLLSINRKDSGIHQEEKFQLVGGFTSLTQLTFTTLLYYQIIRFQRSISPDESAFWTIFSARIFRAILRAENPTGFHVYTNSGFPSWNIPTHLKFLKKKFFHLCILPFFFESHWFSDIIVCVEGAQQKCAASRFCPLMMTAPYCGPPTHRPPDIFHFYKFNFHLMMMAPYCGPPTHPSTTRYFLFL